MFGARKQQKFGAWRLLGHPQVIEYAEPVMEEIAGEVVDGFKKVPHGGIEAGGVLFGEGDKHLVRILAARPIPCEHATGPSFVLSEKDQQELAALLEGAATDPELKGLAPVGWYQARTRSDLRLEPAAAALHERFFPEPWQILLQLKPSAERIIQAGIFARRPDGTLPAEPGFVDEKPAFRPPLIRRPAPVPAAGPAPGALVESVAKAADPPADEQAARRRAG